METPARTARVAILTKGPVLVAAIALDTNIECDNKEIRHVVGSLDPRLNPATHLRSYPDSKEAETNFEAALIVSRSNGWVVAHIGTRN